MCVWPLAGVKGGSTVLSPRPELEYSGAVWVFAPLSGLLLLRPDGSICHIHNRLALSLFGYDQNELLSKVSRDGRLKQVVFPSTAFADSHFCLTAWSPTECHFPDAWFLRMDV